MDVADITTAPYLPLRHARIGRIGESGLLPPHWRSEHIHDVRVLDIGGGGAPWIKIGFRFAADVPAEFVGLGLGPYLPAPKGETVALGAEVAVTDLANVEAVFLVIREWRPGGVFVAQSVWPVPVPGGSHAGRGSHRVSADESLTEAVLMVKRRTPAAGQATLTLKGLAFGTLRDHPGWRPPAAGGA